MFTTNLIIAHHVQDKKGLYAALTEYGQKHHCSVDEGAKEARKELLFPRPKSDDFCFEVFDHADKEGAGVFLSFDDDSSQYMPRIPLSVCFYVLEGIVNVTQQFSSYIDVYITSSRATMLDFQNIVVKTPEVGETLKRLYVQEANNGNVEPDVHLIILKQ